MSSLRRNSLEELLVGAKQLSVLDPDRSKLKPFVILVALCASLGGMIFGFQLTGSGGTFVMEGFKEQFGWICSESDSQCTPLSESEIETERSLISALMTIGATFGALINPRFVEKWGRVSNLRQGNIVFILGAAICSASSTIEVLYAGRFISGLGIGMLALCVPVYIGEVSPATYRGALTTLWQFGVTLGMLTGQGANIGLAKVEWGWRLSYGANIIFAIMFLVGLFTFLPESPRYIAAKISSRVAAEDVEQPLVTELLAKHESKLRSIMKKLRYEQDVDHSVENIQKEVQEDIERGDATWREVFSTEKKMLYRVLLGISLQALNQLSGNEAINFYAPTILESMFGSKSILMSFILGIINFVAVCVGILLVDRVGRIPLFLVGGVAMLISQICSAIYQSYAHPSSTVDTLFFTSLAIFSFAYHSTWGPLAWDICSEMFPLRERAKAVGLTTMSNFLFNTVVAASFSFTIEASPSGSFAFFCCAIFLNLTLVYLFLPETAHKTSLEIDRAFSEHKPKLCRGRRD